MQEYLYLSLAIMILSQAATIIRFADAHPVAIGFWRLVIAVGLLIPLVLKAKNFEQIKKINKKNAVHFFLCGLSLYLHFIFWFYSVQKTTIANAVILFATNPIFTAMGAWILFREKLEKRHLVSLLFCFLGVLMMVWESLSWSGEHVTGDLLGVLSSVLFSTYILSGKNLRKNFDNIPFAFVIYSICMTLFFVSFWILSVPLTGYSNTTWWAFLALALGPTLLGHALFTHCLNYINVNVMSCSTLIQPILSTIVAYFVFHESLKRGTVLGFILVSIGILILYAPLFTKKFGKNSPHAKAGDNEEVAAEV